MSSVAFRKKTGKLFVTWACMRWCTVVVHCHRGNNAWEFKPLWRVAWDEVMLIIIIWWPKIIIQMIIMKSPWEQNCKKKYGKPAKMPKIGTWLVHPCRSRLYTKKGSRGRNWRNPSTRLSAGVGANSWLSLIHTKNRKKRKKWHNPSTRLSWVGAKSWLSSIHTKNCKKIKKYGAIPLPAYLGLVQSLDYCLALIHTTQKQSHPKSKWYGWSANFCLLWTFFSR